MWFSKARKRFGARPTRPRPSIRLRLEALEDRCLLSGGVLDPTFGSGGTVTTTVGAYSEAFAVATYASQRTANDGKFVAVGFAETGSPRTQTNNVAIARYKLDGTLDHTFG